MKATINFKLDQDGQKDAACETFKGIFHIEDVIDQDIKDERIVLGTIYKITYSDGGVKTNLLIDEKEQTVISDSINRLVFKKGQKDTVAYNTPAGIIDLGLDTKCLEIRHDEDEKKLTVHITYDLIQGDTVIDNNMWFTIMYE